MGVNVNFEAMVRAMLGETKPQEGARVLELRVGQVVRGVLVQMLDGQEGIVSINGVPVRARLEADIPVGRGVPLQVLEGPDGATIVLKPLPGWPDAVPDEPLRNLVRAFGLTDEPWALALLHGLKRDGYALDAATARAYATMASLKPPQVDAAQWMAAADVAFRRGLPGTAETVTSLRQALYGQPLQAQMRALADLLDSALAKAPGSGAAWTEAAEAVRRLLAEGSALMETGARLLARGDQTAGQSAALAKGQASGGSAAGAASGAASGPAGDAAGQAPGPAAGAGAADPAADGASAGNALRAADPANGGERTAAAARPGGIAPRATGSAGDLAAGSAAGPRAALSPSRPADTGEPAMAEPRAGHATGGSGRPDTPAAAPARQAALSDRTPHASPSAASLSATGVREGADWLARLLQWLGVGHEHALASAGARAADGSGTGGAGTGPLAPGGSAGADGAASAAGARADGVREETLKSALLALAAREDAPPALREAAQSLAQHITGQQLLLAGGRTPHAPIHHMTLFIPLRDENGDTTAAVHIQTRKGRRGEWDADNIRLLFDLRMRHLGPVVVDVQVVDRIVSLKFWSDEPWFREWADQSRDRLAAALQEAGYRLSSLRAVPFPARPAHHAAATAGERTAKDSAPLFPSGASAPETWPAGVFAARPYKGVDLRI